MEIERGLPVEVVQVHQLSATREVINGPALNQGCLGLTTALAKSLRAVGMLSSSIGRWRHGGLRQDLELFVLRSSECEGLVVLLTLAIQELVSQCSESQW